MQVQLTHFAQVDTSLSVSEQQSFKSTQRGRGHQWNWKKKSFNSSLSFRAGHSEAKAASSLAGAWLCELAAGLRVPTCRPVGPGGRGFSLTSCECGLRFCLSALVLQPSVCVFFRDGRFLHGDLRPASALPGCRRTKERQRLALRRRVENTADWHLIFPLLPHNKPNHGRGFGSPHPSVLTLFSILRRFREGRRAAHQNHRHVQVRHLQVQLEAKSGEAEGEFELGSVRYRASLVARKREMAPW